jgi:hypothetical protein
MEETRIREKNITLSNIKDIKSYIKRHTETIERLHKQTTLSNFDKNQISKLKEKIQTYENDLKGLEKKILEIETGKYDDDFLKKMEEERLKISKSNDKINKKNIEKKQKNIDNKKFVKTSYDITNNYNNNDKFYEKEYSKFSDKCNNIPDYIIRNLKEMPSNKGYIWKGIWCFGKLPPDSKTLIMFEKINGDLRIHESDENFKYIYDKKGKDKKVLISKISRTDFIKKFRIWVKERGY